MVNNKGYICQGDANNKTVWEYDPTADNWTERGVFEGTNRSNTIGFGINGKGYVATGNSGTSRFDDLWEFNPAITQDTNNQ